MTVVGRGRRARRRPPCRRTRACCPASSTTTSASDRSRWQSGVQQFARVRQAGVYDGIDLEFYGNQQRLEYDFLVAPGADPSAIRLRFDGADRIEIDAAGDLLVHAAGGEPLRQQAPISYQVIDGTPPRRREPLRAARRATRSASRSAPTIARSR